MESGGFLFITGRPGKSATGPEADVANRILMKNLYKALLLAAFFSTITAIAALPYGAPWTNTTWREVFLGVGWFGCFGFLLGGIYAFDPESEFRIQSSSTGRMFFGLIASLLLSIIWRWPGEGVALAALVGVLLGYFGMAWARYVDF
jgi:hypothetical protein